MERERTVDRDTEIGDRPPERRRACRILIRLERW
jgi:hypothetical protein